MTTACKACVFTRIFGRRLRDALCRGVSVVVALLPPPLLIADAAQRMPLFIRRLPSHNCPRSWHVAGLPELLSAVRRGLRAPAGHGLLPQGNAAIGDRAGAFAYAVDSLTLQFWTSLHPGDASSPCTLPWFVAALRRPRAQRDASRRACRLDPALRNAVLSEGTASAAAPPPASCACRLLLLCSVRAVRARHVAAAARAGKQRRCLPPPAAAVSHAAHQARRRDLKSDAVPLTQYSSGSGMIVPDAPRALSRRRV